MGVKMVAAELYDLLDIISTNLPVSGESFTVELTVGLNGRCKELSDSESAMLLYDLFMKKAESADLYILHNQSVEVFNQGDEDYISIMGTFTKTYEDILL